MSNLLFLFIFVPILAIALLALNVLLAVHHPDEAKVSAYECGFSPVYGQTRSTFQIQFYIVAMLFLIFDLEILLLFPIAVTLYQVSTFGFSIAIIFFIVLTIGFVLEIGSGAIRLTSGPTESFTHITNSSLNRKNIQSPLTKHFLKAKGFASLTTTTFHLATKSLKSNTNKLGVRGITSFASTGQLIAGGEKSLNPYFVTGFSVAESSFNIFIRPSSKYKTKFHVEALYQIHLHLKDTPLLEKLQDYFGVGKIYTIKNSVFYKVNSITQLSDSVIPHFDKYPLISQKSADYLLWKQIVLKMSRKEHLTLKGVEEIIALRANLNLGLAPNLKSIFPFVVSVPRPIASNLEIKDPNWIVGFAEGEGSFLIKKATNGKSKAGFQYSLIINIAQHSRDLDLMKKIQIFLDCGNV